MEGVILWHFTTQKAFLQYFPITNQLFDHFTINSNGLSFYHEINYQNDNFVERIYVKNQKEGLSIEFGSHVDQRQRIRITHFVNGKEEGPCISWYNCGKIRERGCYHQGKRFGLWTQWDVNGNKIHDAIFADHEWNVEWTFYWSNGKPKEKGKTTNRLRIGEWITWDSDGKESRIQY